MTQNNNVNVLPFYSSIDFQNHKKECAYGEIYPLITELDKILPFQIPRMHSTNAFTVLLYSADGLLINDITSGMIESGMRTDFSTSYDMIINPGIFKFSSTCKEGLYYIVVSDTINTWYSEIFNMVHDISKFIRVMYWDNSDLQIDWFSIRYEGFKNYVYLNTQIGKPEYPFEEEVTKRDGYTFIQKQISEKVYKFTFLAPEYMCDFMRLIRMHDNIQIIDANGFVYNADTFLISPKWETQGDIASVEAEFTCDTVIKKIGKYISKQPSLIGDFNTDFNADYDRTT